MLAEVDASLASAELKQFAEAEQRSQTLALEEKAVALQAEKEVLRVEAQEREALLKK